MRTIRTTILGLALAGACTARDTKPGDSTKTLKAETPSAAAASTSPPPDISDSAPPLLMPGRTKHDSLAYASAVAFGRRMMAKWPAPPVPLPGSILPAKRIVAFYGNPLSRKMGVLGEY